MIDGVMARRKSEDFLGMFHAHNESNKVERGPEDSACSGVLCELKSFGVNLNRKGADVEEKMVAAPAQ